MLESDGIIWARPVYFCSMTSQTKTLMDRMVHQMISLINANIKFPEEFDFPMPRFVKNKYFSGMESLDGVFSSQLSAKPLF